MLFGLLTMFYEEKKNIYKSMWGQRNWLEYTGDILDKGN